MSGDDLPYNAALSRLNFGPVWSGGNYLTRDFATCRICGACVTIEPAVIPADQPATIHHEWHVSARLADYNQGDESQVAALRHRIAPWTDAR